MSRSLFNFDDDIKESQPMKVNSDTIPAINRYPKKNSKVETFRKDEDFYPTPDYVTEALFSKEKFEGIVLEPSCGHGNMSRIIEKYNKCISSDLRDNIEVYGMKGIDFLKITEKYDNIITNPPFKLATEFVLQSKKLATKKIALLLPIGFFEGKKRYNIFIDKEFPLSKILVFSRRVQFMEGSKNAPIGTVCWFIWNKEYIGNPTIEWISPDTK